MEDSQRVYEAETPMLLKSRKEKTEKGRSQQQEDPQRKKMRRKQKK